jgi:hypothetical protein
MEGEHAASLEEKLATLEGQVGDTNDRINQIFEYITKQKLKDEPVAPESPRVSRAGTPIDHRLVTGTPEDQNQSLGNRQTRLAKPASPPDFDGDRQKGTAFLNACQTYIRLRPDDFTDEQMQIVWAMSYMKTG